MRIGKDDEAYIADFREAFLAPLSTIGPRILTFPSVTKGALVPPTAAIGPLIRRLFLLPPDRGRHLGNEIRYSTNS